MSSGGVIQTCGPSLDNASAYQGSLNNSPSTEAKPADAGSPPPLLKSRAVFAQLEAGALGAAIGTSTFVT